MLPAPLTWGHFRDTSSLNQGPHWHLLLKHVSMNLVVSCIVMHYSRYELSSIFFYKLERKRIELDAQTCVSRIHDFIVTCMLFLDLLFLNTSIYSLIMYHFIVTCMLFIDLLSMNTSIYLLIMQNSCRPSILASCLVPSLGLLVGATRSYLHDE